VTLHELTKAFSLEEKLFEADFSSQKNVREITLKIGSRIRTWSSCDSNYNRLPRSLIIQLPDMPICP
jgi:hypothetical protein